MSASPIQFQAILLPLGSQLPLLLVYFIGLILALTQLQRFPRVALLVIFAFGFLLALSLVQPFIHSLAMNAIMRAIESGPRGQSYNYISAGLAFAFSLLRAIPVAILGYAAFVDRPGPFLSAAKQPQESRPSKVV